MTATERQTKSVGIAIAATVLALSASVPAHADGSDQRVFQACLAAAENQSDSTAARNHCRWKHFERMASWGK